jgi:hypothetical protein
MSVGWIEAWVAGVSGVCDVRNENDLICKGLAEISGRSEKRISGRNRFPISIVNRKMTVGGRGDIAAAWVGFTAQGGGGGWILNFGF